MKIFRSIIIETINIKKKKTVDIRRFHEFHNLLTLKKVVLFISCRTIPEQYIFLLYYFNNSSSVPIP